MVNKKICTVAIIVACLVVCIFVLFNIFKNTQVIRVDDTTLSYNGYEYKLLTEEDPYVRLYEKNTKTVYITDKGTPALFSKLFHEDWKGMSHTVMTENKYFVGNDIYVYCREDIYPKLKELKSSIEYDLCIYEYHTDSETNVYTLTAEEFNTVKSVLDEEVFIPSYELGYSPAVEYTIDLALYDEQTGIGEGYERLHVIKDGYCFTRLVGGQTEYCVVPQKYIKYFDSITMAIY